MKQEHAVNLCLQGDSGESQGESCTFREHLYQQPVDKDSGKSSKFLKNMNKKLRIVLWKTC